MYEAGAHGSVWRLTRGLLRLERTEGTESRFVRLAHPGDVLGVEALCGRPYTFTAIAVTAAEITPEPLPDEGERFDLMSTAFLQGQARTLEAMHLRSGSVSVRLQRFLSSLESATGTSLPDWPEWEFPYLRDIAQVVDLTPESVCRVLSELGRPRVHRGGRRRRLQALHPAQAAEAAA